MFSIKDKAASEAKMHRSEILCGTSELINTVNL